MIVLSSLDELNAANSEVGTLKLEYPDLFEKLLHAVNLTRQLQLKYDYLGCMLTDDIPGQYAPVNIPDSVADMYHLEIMKAKNHNEFYAAKQLFFKSKDIGFANISMLILGRSPEQVKGI
ncbi:hypothetical protein EV207_1089 [Scopulibacillus darangshiensis]|uniref:Uncharacterized protein n=1 Tax=Scopulibacillus darangshiensis TaxID=442528 RepID=A0A4R2P670_9BACL|nr:hypothetical protein [Scopulibacillus darangshiensis]TCP29718.1 hypothetical protein EV207_1089 [Scopulibacillus darangshiensis]